MTEHPQKNKLEHPCFPQPSDSTVIVWRYLDLAKFIWLLENQKLYLSRLDLLNDPHEGSTPRFLAEQWNQQLLQFSLDSCWERLVQKFGSDLGNERFIAEIPKIKQQILQMRAANKDRRKYLYVNCWHLGNPESEAMWRLYCPGNNGVAIQTSYRKLVESIINDSELYIGQVTYIDYESQGFPQDNIFYPVMHKRISFAHEQEVRLVKIRVPDNFGFPQEFSPQGITFDWPLESTIEAIYVNPYAPEYYCNVVRTIVRHIAPNLEDSVRWSQMRASPIY